ncbi:MULTISPECIES: twin-arginine translocase TatA/TatE family subunit [unclassified Roseitalea]|uniref:twin-arginine translocase TatA/TatE family subunit n=1 Tax=unclassified Roseitalea TaxID=2639107 RepID=UPI00273F0195|nr:MULTISPECIES: twin-arginine translocase TatA/TatE family subunit [unclassified Roseitalea]
MGAFSIWQWIIVLVIVLLLFGRGKIPELMGDVAKGIRNFRTGMKDESEEDDEHSDTVTKTVEHKAEEPVKPAKDAVNKS